MPKLTYRAQTPDDPTFTSCGQYKFEHGKSVEVDEPTYEALKSNPWFKGGREAKDQAAAASAAGDAGARLDSSVDLAMPPGSGSKYPGAELVATGDGLVPAEEASSIDGANTPDEQDDEPRRRGRPPKHG